MRDTSQQALAALREPVHEVGALSLDRATCGLGGTYDTAEPPERLY